MELKKYVEEGSLAPTSLVVQVLNNRVQHTNAKVIVFDGSPRREGEIEPFFDMLVNNEILLSRVIIFHLEREVAFKRLTGRRVCPVCGKIYNIYYHPPQDSH